MMQISHEYRIISNVCLSNPYRVCGKRYMVHPGFPRTNTHRRQRRRPDCSRDPDTQFFTAAAHLEEVGARSRWNRDCPYATQGSRLPRALDSPGSPSPLYRRHPAVCLLQGLPSPVSVLHDDEVYSYLSGIGEIVSRPFT